LIVDKQPEPEPERISQIVVYEYLQLWFYCTRRIEIIDTNDKPNNAGGIHNTARRVHQGNQPATVYGSELRKESPTNESIEACGLTKSHDND